MATKKIDVRGTSCPMPLIHLAKAVAELEDGGTVEIVGDDPIFELGVREFCQARGCSVKQVNVNGREVRLELAVGEPEET